LIGSENTTRVCYGFSNEITKICGTGILVGDGKDDIIDTLLNSTDPAALEGAKDCGDDINNGTGL